MKASFGTIGVTSLAISGFTSRCFIQNDNSEPNEIERIENSELLLRVFETGTFSVTMKSTNSQWRPDPWEGIACRITYETQSGNKQIVDFGSRKIVEITKNYNSINMTFKGSNEELIVKTSISLKDNVLGIIIDDVSIPGNTRLVSIDYPFRSFYLLSEMDEGYFVLPEGEGCLIPTYKEPYGKELGTTQFWSWHDRSHSESASIKRTPSMPFYGAQKEGSGYTAIIETTDDFEFQYLINYDFQHNFDNQGKQSPFERIVCAWPSWLSQKGEFGYKRHMRLEFSDNLNYIGIAKAYRKEAIVKGDYVSLREKAKIRPQVDKLAGALYLAYYAGYPHTAPGYFDYTYQHLIDVVNDLAGPMGMKRAFVHFWGAYSVQPPGCLPFDNKPGSIENLRTAVEKCKNAGFLFTLYNDISAQLEETNLWLPELMWKSEDLKVRRGRRWSRNCSSQYIDLLSKHMPEVTKTLGLEACYVDCINSGRMDECYDPNHPLTRTDDRKARLKFYQYVHSLGLIFGGEHSGWWNAAELEYTNGVGGMSRSDFFNLFPVPLYQLVFHDALIAFCHAGDDYSLTEGTSFEDKILRDLLRGIPPMFFINLWDHKKWRNKIQNCYNVISDVAAEVMYDEMVSHEWITTDQMVQQSEFASGVKIAVNFDEIERKGIPAKGYRVSGMKSGARKGNFKTNWEAT